MQTNIPAGSPLARKVFGVALFALTQRQPSLRKNLTGPAPKQGQAESKLKGQTSPDMPFVRVTDLSRGQGDTVSVDLFNVVGGKPIMGDRMAEGKGVPLTSSSMDIKIDLTTKVVDAGGKMSQQRTVHQLRGIAMANLVGYMSRLEDQRSLVHVAGARGSQNDQPDWVVPTSDDPDFAEIMVNDIKAPTRNRHYVANGTGVTNGGEQLESIASTDTFKLEHLDALATILDDNAIKMGAVKVPDDPAADDEPMYLMLVTHRMWNSILTNTSNLVWRTFLQNAWQRKSYGSKHPLFSGEPGMWRNILVRKIDRAIRFNAGDGVKYVAEADRYTASETTATVNAIGSDHAVDRGILLGAQGLANVYGKNQQSDYYYSWQERKYNFGRNLEVAGESMGGVSKVRFNVATNGTTEPTDIGVLVLDACVPLT